MSETKMWNKLRSRCCRKILSNGAEHKRCAEHCTENIINIIIASIHYWSYIMVSAQLSRYGLDENTWGPKWNNKNWVGFSCHYSLFLQIYQFCKVLKFIKAFAWQKSINICRQTVTNSFPRVRHRISILCSKSTMTFTNI